MELARAGDRESLETIVERHYSVLRAILIRYGGIRPDDVEELLQEARVVGCPEGTVKSRIHYALRKLRGLLADPSAGRASSGKSGGWAQ